MDVKKQHGPDTHTIALLRFTEACDAFRRGELSQDGMLIRLHLLIHTTSDNTAPPEFLKRMADTLRAKMELLADVLDSGLRTLWAKTIHTLENRIEKNEREKVALQRMHEGPICICCGFTMQPDGTGFLCTGCGATIITARL